MLERLNMRRRLPKKIPLRVLPSLSAVITTVIQFRAEPGMSNQLVSGLKGSATE